MLLLGRDVARAGDVDDRPGADARGEEERGELDQVDGLGNARCGVSRVQDAKRSTVNVRRRSRRRFRLFHGKGDEVSLVQRGSEVAVTAQRTINLANHKSLSRRVLFERLDMRRNEGQRHSSVHHLVSVARAVRHFALVAERCRRHGSTHHACERQCGHPQTSPCR